MEQQSRLTVISNEQHLFVCNRVIVFVVMVPPEVKTLAAGQPAISFSQKEACLVSGALRQGIPAERGFCGQSAWLRDVSMSTFAGACAADKPLLNEPVWVSILLASIVTIITLRLPAEDGTALCVLLMAACRGGGGCITAFYIDIYSTYLSYCPLDGTVLLYNAIVRWL